MVRHSGEKHFVSILANNDSFSLLKKPTYRKSPTALKRKTAAIAQTDHSPTLSGSQSI